MSIYNLNKGTGFRFMEKSYADTVELLVLTRDYFTINGKRDRMVLQPDDKLVYTIIMSNMTIQLSKALSWLMLQKAINNGEITADDAMVTSTILPDIDLYQPTDADIERVLPEPARKLLQKNNELYLRVKRLSDNMRNSHTSHSKAS